MISLSWRSASCEAASLSVSHFLVGIGIQFHMLHRWKGNLEFATESVMDDWQNPIVYRLINSTFPRNKGAYDLPPLARLLCQREIELWKNIHWRDTYSCWRTSTVKVWSAFVASLPVRGANDHKQSLPLKRRTVRHKLPSSIMAVNRDYPLYRFHVYRSQFTFGYSVLLVVNAWLLTRRRTDARRITARAAWTLSNHLNW